jgi:ribose transport system permease protein
LRYGRRKIPGGFIKREGRPSEQAILTSRLNSAQPTAGTGYELDAIAAVVLGGTSLSGGKGRIFGTIIGALIIGTLNNGLNILNVSSFYQQVVKGIVILLAVLMDRKKN